MLVVGGALIFGACLIVFAACVASGRADNQLANMELFPDMDVTLSPRESWAIDHEVSTFLKEDGTYRAENWLGHAEGPTRAEALDALADYLEADHLIPHWRPAHERA